MFMVLLVFRLYCFSLWFTLDGFIKARPLSSLLCKWCIFLLVERYKHEATPWPFLVLALFNHVYVMEIKLPCTFSGIWWQSKICQNLDFGKEMNCKPPLTRIRVDGEINDEHILNVDVFLQPQNILFPLNFQCIDIGAHQEMGESHVRQVSV